MQKIYKLQGI